MDRLKHLWSDTFWRIWGKAILPTSAIFLLAAFAVKSGVRQRLEAQLPGSSAVFDQIFHGQYIFVGGLVAMAVSTCLTFLVMHRGVDAYRDVVRLTQEIAAGNYHVRADEGRVPSAEYTGIAANVNALAESLERTEKLRRELVSNLAHEIRTPLTNLQGYLEALRDGVIPANPEALASVHEEVMRLVRLVDALHQLARADAMRRQTVDKTPTDLDDLAEQLVRVIRPNAEVRGIRIYLDLDSYRRPAPVHADSVAQVMRNLLRNAVQYAEENGTIRVQSVNAHGVYRFGVLNTGPGIDPQDLPFIFDRFFRSEQARAGVKTGVGIGLAIAKELVEAHGGRMGAQSKAGWTMVWFELPTELGVKLEAETPGFQV